MDELMNFLRERVLRRLMCMLWARVCARAFARHDAVDAGDRAQAVKLERSQLRYERAYNALYVIWARGIKY